MGSGAHARLFDLASVPYDLFFHSQRRAFRAHGDTLGLPPGARILDIGCGTGALASVVAERGFAVHAVDPSAGMRGRARRRLRGTGVVLSDGDPLAGLAFADGTFDLVIASYVVHGMPATDRATFYREALRVSKGLVIFQDHAPRSSRHGTPDAPVLETLERSDYRRFVRTGAAEMRLEFGSVEVVPIGPGSAWYVCRAAGAPASSIKPGKVGGLTNALEFRDICRRGRLDR